MFVFCFPSESQLPPKDAAVSEAGRDDLTMLKSLADGQKPAETREAPAQKEDRYVPDESDSTKSRRLAEDYDSTKNKMDYDKYQGTQRVVEKVLRHKVQINRQKYHINNFT